MHVHVREDPSRKDWGRHGHGHCVQPYSWDELVDGYQGRHIPYKVGGLGKRLEPGGYQTWVCLLDDTRAATLTTAGSITRPTRCSCRGAPTRSWACS
jgi:hypothetical protein